ncbi:hypothetical protein V7S43_016158 [Phytophthora oleae]|uniref:SSD domain-containing protein n=1 Tax=Phytophthora oleae TaxID=2107226 RepID=A0ABD3EY02_9STRA
MTTEVSVIAITCHNFGFFLSYRVGSNMRSLVMSCIFYKSLRLSSAVKQQCATVQVLTLTSVGAERVFNAMMQGPWLVGAPLGFGVVVALIGLLFDAVILLLLQYLTTRDVPRAGQGLDAHTVPDGLMDEVCLGVHLMEKTLGVTFADATNPLLVSMRSGAAISRCPA